MASVVLKFAKNTLATNYMLRPISLKQINRIPLRHRVTTESGAFLPEPKRMHFGLARVLLTVLLGLYLGATISKEGAAFLEENDIFVPDEDDDED